MKIFLGIKSKIPADQASKIFSRDEWSQAPGDPNVRIKNLITT